MAVTRRWIAARHGTWLRRCPSTGVKLLAASDAAGSRMLWDQNDPWVWLEPILLAASGGGVCLLAPRLMQCSSSSSSSSSSRRSGATL